MSSRTHPRSHKRLSAVSRDTRRCRPCLEGLEDRFLPALFGNAGSFALDPGAVSPHAVGVGNFNGDGYQDLAVANGGGTVSVLLGNGPGSFGPARSFFVGEGASSVAVGDFNGDRHQDLAVATSANLG